MGLVGPIEIQENLWKCIRVYTCFNMKLDEKNKSIDGHQTTISTVMTAAIPQLWYRVFRVHGVGCV